MLSVDDSRRKHDGQPVLTIAAVARSRSLVSCEQTDRRFVTS